jgi:hypothetical protein
MYHNADWWARLAMWGATGFNLACAGWHIYKAEKYRRNWEDMRKRMRDFKI